MIRCLPLLFVVGCSSTNDPTRHHDSRPGDTEADADTDTDTDTVAPDPDQLDPCGDGVCWETELPVQLCHSASEEEDFSSGSYNVHRYSSSAQAGAETRIQLTRTAGSWQPALVIARVDGSTISDGEIGAVTDGLEVDVLQSGRGGGEAQVSVTSDTNIGLYVYVTGWGAIDSGFVDFQPQDSTYTLDIESVCDDPSLDCSGPMVSGHSVAEPACGWLEYFGRELVPALAGGRDERLDVAAIVAWWSLKEGVLFLDNPIVYSNCAFESGSEYIGPLETCPSGRAWQVGISGIQVPTFLDGEPAEQAAALFPTVSEDEVLESTAVEALLSAAEIDGVVASTGDLRASWLLRNSPIGVTLQVDIVERECIDGSYDWCYGSGWDSTALYAPDKDSAMGAIADIREILDGLAP